jgi:hypothetical protein
MHFDEIDPVEGVWAKQFLWTPLDQNSSNFSVVVASRQGQFVETIKVVGQDGEDWQNAIKVIDGSSKKILLHCRDPKFPVSAEFPDNLPHCFPQYIVGPVERVPETEHPTIEQPPQRSEISVDWHNIYSPVLPSEGRVAILSLEPVPESMGGDGLAEVSGKPGAAFAGKDSLGAPARIHQYQITGYAPRTMFNVSIALHLIFKEAIRNKRNTNQIDSGKITLERDWIIKIAKIDPGPDHPFIFYAMNESGNFVSVSFPETATAQMAGNNAVRGTVRIITPGPDLSYLAPAK